MTVRELILRYTEKYGRAPTVSLVGFGVTNRAVFDRLREYGITPTVRQGTPVTLPEGVRGIFGEGYLSSIGEDILLLSPSVRRDIPPLTEAASRGSILTSECEVFFADGLGDVISPINGGESATHTLPYPKEEQDNATHIPTYPTNGPENATHTLPYPKEGRENASHPLPCGGKSRQFATRPPTYTVTGSDGKSTVTAMAAAMLGLPAVGNIGTPYSRAEGAIGHVCELSSFNLQYLTPRADVCAITNITPNHLDWHTSMEEYISAKARITLRAARTVMNADDGISRTLLLGGEILFSTRLDRGALSALGAAHAIYLSRGVILYDGEPILPACELALGQEYNLRNFMAAVGLAHGVADLGRIREVGRSFTPLSHRCEAVHTSTDGVVFLDSSIDTTPMRTLATVTGLSRPVLLLLGGRGKGLSFEPLLPAVRDFATAVAIYGEVGGEIYSPLHRGGITSQIPVSLHEKFDSALSALTSLAAAGDTVLLSPAATAYGEFRNFEERGRHFASRAKEYRP